MKSSYKILITEKLVLKKFRGTISIVDMKVILRETKQLNETYPNFNIIIDYRGTDFLFGRNEFVQLMQSYKKSTFSTLLKIFITDTPKQFVIYNFFKDNYSFKNTQIFHTLEAACATNGLPIKKVKKFLI